MDREQRDAGRHRAMRNEGNSAAKVSLGGTLILAALAMIELGGGSFVMYGLLLNASARTDPDP
jgi:hypothetical protein